MLSWESYAQILNERFGSSMFQYPMGDLVSLRLQGMVDQYDDTFGSLLNQLHQPESYAPSIFISDLKAEIW